MARKIKKEIAIANGDGFDSSPAEQNATIAEALYNVEVMIANLEEKKDEFRTQLMQNLKEQGVKSVRLDNGDMYIRAQRLKLVIKDEGKARVWALENPEARMKLDTSAALEVARLGVKFFEVGHTEYLQIKRRRSNDETETQVDDG